MAKLTSGRVKRTPPSGITSDRYQFLGLEQAEPSLGDPLVGPSSIGANPIKVGAFYQLASIAEYPGERYWSTQVGIGTTLGIISVYANDQLPNNAFGRIHGLNFVGTGVTIETPSVGFIGDVGIATIRFAVTDILNQGQPGQVLYNGPNGLALGSVDLNYYNGNVGIGTSTPTSKLEVIGDVFISGDLTASNFYGDFFGTATNATNVIGGIASVTQLDVSGISTLGTIQISAGIVSATTGIATYYGNLIGTATNVIGGIASVTSLSVSGVSTLGGIQISSGIVSATTGIATYYGNLIGNADFASIAGFAYTTYADNSGFSTTSGIATSVIGGIASVTSLRVSGISTLGITSTTQFITQNLNVSGVSTLGFVTGTDAYYTGVITATRFLGDVTGFVDNAGYAKTAGISTDVIGGIASVTNLNVTGFSTLANVYVNDTISGPSIIYIDPTVVGDDTGTVVIKGNLEVKGTTTTIESQTLTVVDKNIELATGSPSDSVSDGGGITLKGDTDHTISFNDADDAWEFSENLTPNSDNSKDLGTPSKKWKTLYVNNIYSGFTSTTDLNVSGVSTLGITSATQLTVSGVSTLGFITASDAFFTGVVTATRFYGIVDGFVDNATYATKSGVSTDVIGGIASVTDLNVTGISTLGGIQISAGIVSATTGIATYYGRFIGTADFATTAGFAYTVYADTSGFSTTSGISTNLNGGASGSIPYQNNPNSTVFLPGSSTNGWVLTYDTGSNAPVWTNPSTGVNAGTADYATSAGIATYATSAGIATYAINAGIATDLSGGNVGSIPYQNNTNDTTFLAASTNNGWVLTYDTGSNAPVWTNPSTGVNVGTADYATNSGFSTNAGIATYATYAGFSTNSGIATNLKGGSTGSIPYQFSAGVTTFLADPNVDGRILTWDNTANAPVWTNPSTGVNVGTADYATNSGFSTNAGIATYATYAGFSTNSGISTNLKGGSASQIPYQTGADTTAFIPNGSPGQVLKSNGSSVPSWDNITNLGAASTITILGDTSDQNQYLTFVTGVGDTTLGIATTSTSLTFNPSTGNLGIGTTNPLEKLDVNGTTRLRGLLKDFNNSQGTPGQLLQSTSTGVSWVSANAIGAATTINIIGDTTNQNQYLTFVTGVGDTTIGIATTSTALTFNPSTGSLGIGTTNPNPDVYLSVGSPTLNKVNNTAQFGNLGIGNQGPQNAFISLNGNWNPNTSEWFYNQTGHTSILQFTNGNTYLRYAESANAGSATTSIYTILKLGRNKQVSINKSYNDNTNSNLVVDIRQSLYTDRQYSDLGLVNPFLVGITTVGNVGIGTTNPTSKLHVVGDVRVSGTTSNLFTVTDNTTTGSIFSVNDISGTPYVDVNATTGAITLGPINGRNVGIGTTNPTRKLSVNGDIGIGRSIYDSNNLSGTAGQVLQSTGTGVSWTTGYSTIIPQNLQPTNYTLALSDSGKHISIGATVTVPSGVFSTGNNVVIYNSGSTSIGINTAGSTGLVLRFAGSNLVGTRTLAGYGVATLLCVANNTFVISGVGLV